MDFSDYRHLRFVRRGRVLEIAIDRAEQMNAFNAR